MLELLLLIVFVGLCTGAGLLFALWITDQLLKADGAPEGQHEDDEKGGQRRRA